MTAILTALFSILLFFQSVPFGGGSRGNHASSGITFIRACNHLQTTSSTTIAINIGATGTCSPAANPAAGDTVLVHITTFASPTSASATDTLGNTWACIFSNTNNEVHCRSKLTTGGADTVTITTQSTTGTAISMEFSGLTDADTSSVYSSLGGTTWTLGASGTTDTANTVVIGCSGNAVNVTFTQSGSWILAPGAQAQNASPPLAAACVYQIESSIGSFTPVVTVSSSNSGVGFTISFF